METMSGKISFSLVGKKTARNASSSDTTNVSSSSLGDVSNSTKRARTAAAPATRTAGHETVADPREFRAPHRTTFSGRSQAALSGDDGKNDDDDAKDADADDADELSDAETRSNWARMHKEKGDKLAEDGELEAALAQWQQALFFGPYFYLHSLAAGCVHSRVHRLHPTFLAPVLDPENAVLHEQRSQVFLELDNPFQAIKAAEAAVAGNPSWAVVCTNSEHAK